MQTLRLAVLVCLAFAVSEIKGGDYFDLGDALDDGPPTTKKPLPTKKPGSDGGFHLEDAFGEDGFAPKPKPGGGNAGGNIGDDDLAIAAGGHPNQPGGGGNFGDDDLHHAAGNKPGGSGRSGDSSNEPNQPSNDGQNNNIAAICGGIGSMVVAAIGSFIMYKKKMLCFKEGVDNENVDGKSDVLHELRRGVVGRDY